MIVGWGLVVVCCAGCDCGSRSKERQRPVEAPAPSETAASRSAKPPKPLLATALRAAGGSAKLKQASSFRASYRSTLPSGKQERGTFWYRPGASRLRVQLEGGGHYDLITHLGGCSWVYGRVVVPCPDRRTSMAKRYHAAYEASWLWPLEGEGWTVTSGTATVDDQVFDTLVARKKGHDFDVQLYVDGKTKLVRRVAVPEAGEGVPRLRASVRPKFEMACGIPFPLQEIAYLGKEKLFTVDLADVECGGVSTREVAVPEQVAHGTVEEREVGPVTLLCHVGRSSYSGMGDRFETLNRYASKRGLPRRREIAWIRFASAPQASGPLPEVAEVCLDVGGATPAEPQVAGAFVLRREPAYRVVSAYGIGPYGDRVLELAGLLEGERTKRSLPPDAPVWQLGSMVAQDGPREAMVSELQIVLSGESP
ncbi:MAG: hypothetical protein JRI23_01565 [Deltaproteobacteria bacterium]|jgi:hypothetical protein|nr:hypothetical protein [Deltaproteobacteria bacterium]MBW2530154.1 hypothetical protein [Deltaproteobacteria bacterium]